MARKIPMVDTWVPTEKDVIFSNAKNIIIAPLTALYKIEEGHEDFNMFMINPKKSYNSDLLRHHTCHYLNYFEKFFDEEKEYFTNMAHIKYLIDFYPEFNFNNFIYELKRYIIQDSLQEKLRLMTEHNYSLELSYKSANNPQLQYTNDHGKIMMRASLMMNLCIPLITHFAYTKRINEIDDYLLDIYDNIIYAPVFEGVDIYSKLFETTFSNVSRHVKNNAGVWAKQPIRGKDDLTHTQSAIINIIVNIMPKYTFDKNMVSLDYTSIQSSNKFQVTDIAYEYSYVALNSSKREGEDNASDFDRYEANLTKADETLYLQSKINYQFVMDKIEKQWGPFDPDEVKFYLQELKNENGEIINRFQKQLVFNLFYKYFGDTTSIKGINAECYVKLMLAAKKMLQQSQESYLPYIISGKVNKIVSRKTLNKQESLEMESSQYFPMVEDKYRNKKTKQHILSTIATIITSNFSIIDYKDPEVHGKQILVESKALINEVLLYTLII